MKTAIGMKKQPKNEKDTIISKLKKTKYLLIIFLSSVGILTFLIYYRSLHAPLIFDDIIYISSSKLKNLPDNITLHARSVAKLSFALNYQISGMNLAAFRITNILFI